MRFVGVRSARSDNSLYVDVRCVAYAVPGMLAGVDIILISEAFLSGVF